MIGLWLGELPPPFEMSLLFGWLTVGVVAVAWFWKSRGSF